jgi:hypothetical protein
MLGSRVLYRKVDIEACEESYLRVATEASQACIFAD